MSDLSQDASLLQEYLNECDELLQRLDQDMVALESAPEDSATLNRIFRAIHTIKGTSGFMGFTPVVELTHHAEDVLNLLRKGERKVTRRTMDVLLGVIDQLRRMQSDLRQGSVKTYELGTLLGSLKQLMEGGEDRPMLGEILVAQRVLSHNERSEALTAAVHQEKKLGEVVVEQHLASASQVKDALKQQSAPPAGAGDFKDVARTIRVDVTKLDALVNLVGELVLERNRLLQLNRDLAQQRIAAEKFEASFSQATARLSFITEELQSASLKTRMVPIDMTFRRFPRMVRDLARGLGKEVELIITGEETELDKTVVEEISDPLIHLVRNALDHGIESPEQREAAGKPRKGVIRLDAAQEGNHITVRVSDDGDGIHPQRIAKKVIEKRLMPAERVRTMSDRELIDLIFLPGFTTTERVSDVSGRGVGMDVVRTNLERINGIVHVESEPGRGSVVTLRLPLTLAILPALLVRVEDETYALPLRSVIEAVRVKAADVHRVDNCDVLRLRERVLPLMHLRRTLRVAAAAAGNGNGNGNGTAHPVAQPVGNERSNGRAQDLCVVVIGVGEQRLGVAVDELLGQEETVIKPRGSYLTNAQGVAGATIGGDGRIRLILDPAGIAAAAGEMRREGRAG